MSAREEGGSDSSLAYRCRPFPWSGQNGLHAFGAIQSIPQARGGQHAIYGLGVSLDEPLARAAAVGELMERTCAVAPPAPGHALRGKACDLPAPSTGLTIFRSLAPRQMRRFPAARHLRDDTEVEWCRARSLIAGHNVLVPAALMHFEYGGKAPNDCFPELVGTGFACGETLEDAVLAGIREWIERDALVSAWHNRIPLQRLTCTGLDLDPKPFSPDSSTLSVYAVPTDLASPVVVAVSTHPVGPPCLTFGAACGPTQLAAAVKAAGEACLLRHLLRHRANDAFAGPIRTLGDHARFYATKRGAALFSRHLAVADGPPSPVGHGESREGRRPQLRDLLGEFEQLGLDVLAEDLTSPAVSDAGAHVVRVLIPGLANIVADARFAPLGCERVVRSRRPVSTPGRKTSKLNYLPVPLA